MAYQPICPIRKDAKCMGAMCALSRHSVDSKGVWLFTCAMTDGKGVPVIDRREAGKDPVERT